MYLRQLENLYMNVFVIEQLFFELLRVAIKVQNTLSRIPSAEEWDKLYRMSKKQSLVGISFAGIQRVVEYEKIYHCGMPELLYFTWMGMAAKIQQRNEVVNRQCVELQEKLSADGFRSYIMKGQAVGSLYGLIGLLRQSGDIDVFLEGGLNKVLAYARTYGGVAKVNELEMSVSIFPDTEVEFHYRPFIMRNPFKNRRLQKYFESQEKKQFSNYLILDKEKELSICAPTVEFNLVHQLVHTYHHFITEGVGLRQLMDYYFVIQASNAEDIRECKKIVENLGLNRFASALMWVIKTVFVGHDNDIFFPWRPNEKDGRLLLEEILLSGNFGHADERAKNIQTSKWKAFWYVNGKTFRFWRFDHWAWFWSPLWRFYYFAWRIMKGF